MRSKCDCGRDLPRWWKVVAYREGEETKPVVGITVGEEERPVLLKAVFYDKDKNPVLAVVTCQMQGIAPEQLQQLRTIVQAQRLTPVLMLPDRGVDFMELVPVSDTDGKRITEDARRALQEKNDQRIVKPS
jgi:hypothetical protein